jgi:hypothetical protein
MPYAAISYQNQKQFPQQRAHRKVDTWLQRLPWLLPLFLLAACATSIAPPTVVQGLSNEQKASLRLTDVTSEAAPGVAITPDNLARVTARVKAEIQDRLPGVFLAINPTAPGQAMRIKLVFTRYDEGNAFARFMLAGLGQIHLDADVTLLDSVSGAVIAQYQIAKTFAFGGVYGGTTNMSEVEKGFAKSVADAIRPKN